MSEIVASTKRGKFFRNVAALLSGKVLEAIVGFGSMPIIARIFTPEVYGVAASIIATTTMLMPLATLSYERGIILTKSSDEEIALTRIVFFSSLCLSILLLFFLWINKSVSLFTIKPELNAWLWVVSIYVILRAILLSLEQMMIKRDEFNWLATTGVVNVTVTALIKLIWGVLHGSFVVIFVIAYTVGLLAKICMCTLKIKDLKKKMKTHLGPKVLASVAKDFSEFPKFQMIGSLFRAAANNLPVILFVSIYSPAVAGVYAMTLRLSRRPLEMFLNSYRTVFLKQSADLQDDITSLRALFLKHTITIAIVGGILFLVLFWLSPKLIPWLLGSKWMDVGGYLQIIMPWLFSLLLSLPSVSVFVVIRKQKIWAQITIITSVLQILAIGGGKYVSLPIENVLWAYSAIGTITSIILIFRADRFLKK